MFQSGFLIRGHRSSCFWVGSFLQCSICFHVNIKARSLVSISICTWANTKSVVTCSAGAKHPDDHSYPFRNPYFCFYFSPRRTHIHTRTASLEMLWWSGSCKGSNIRLQYREASCKRLLLCSLVWTVAEPGTTSERAYLCFTHTNRSPLWIRWIFESISQCRDPALLCALVFQGLK